MTVGSKVKQALANLKSAQADFESFALSTQNKGAKQLWGDAARQVKGVVQQVEDRVQKIEKEESEYQGY